VHHIQPKYIWPCNFYMLICINYVFLIIVELFNALPPGLQRSMLLKAAESVKDTLHQCRLLLLVVDRYPAQVEEQGVRN